jgi:hypothetical protein
MAGQVKSKAGSWVITSKDAEFNYFKALVQPVNKEKPYAYTVHVEYEECKKFAYVCTDGIRIHILRTPDKFEFFEPGNYSFNIKAKEISFTRLETKDFPNWRKVIPSDTRVVAQADISRRTRSQYLIGLYQAGILINTDYLADLEILDGFYSILAGAGLSKAMRFNKMYIARDIGFEAVIMPSGRGWGTGICKNAC